MRSIFFILLTLICSLCLATPHELSKEELKSLISQQKPILFLGHGSKNQFKDIEQVYRDLDRLIIELDSIYGKGKWIATFGGDSYKEEKIDIAHVIFYLQSEKGINILAVQNGIVKTKWGGVDDHIDYVHYVPTLIRPDGSGDVQVNDQGDPLYDIDGSLLIKGRVVWGGLMDGQPVGPTATYLGPNFLEKMKEVILVGGGKIAKEEAYFAYQQGLTLRNIKAEAAFPDPQYSNFGAAYDWAIQQKTGVFHQNESLPQATQNLIPSQEKSKASLATCSQLL